MTIDQGHMTADESDMTIEECLDGDFGTSLYEHAMRDHRNIPQALSDMLAAIRVVRAERDGLDRTLAHMEEIATRIQAKVRGMSSRADAGQLRTPGISEGSKRHKVFMIVSRLAQENGGSVRTDEIMAEMERQNLFQNVSGNKRQNVANMLYDLKQAKLLESDHGNWFPPVRRSVG